ncbi:hypothetical protein [Mesorhizobium sp. dw_380]|uniref:hypothetical protein n=1 Tax=Mesorhizobium sp. dw_380 TaxID=2812001 RepID=UPI001BDE32E3|nr:hypothetical protein [Mesorhizobium sp. dw_380]
MVEISRRQSLAAGAAALGAILVPRIASATARVVAAEVNFSSLAGSTDDVKLANFCTTYKTAAYKPTLVLDELRAYDFSNQQLVYSGFAMVGADRRAVDQGRTPSVLPQIVNINQPSPRGWLTLPNGEIFGLYLSGLSFNANATSRLFHPNDNCVIWTSTFRDISWQNGPSLFGSSTVKQPMTACVMDGFWNVNNVTEQAFCLAGSDCRFVPSTLFLDSPPSMLAASGFLMQTASQSKTTIANFYVTADGHSALVIDGEQSMLRIRDCEFEGRNAAQPCFGALIVALGGYTQLANSWISFGMSNPTGNGRSDGGLISVTGGTFEVLNCHTRRADGVPEASPFVYASGADTKVIVRNIVGEGYSGKPVVRAIDGAVADVDASVQLVTV